MKKIMFFVFILFFCFGSLAFFAMNGSCNQGLLKTYTAYLMND